MTTTADLLTDAFARVREAVGHVLEGISPAVLTFRPDPRANTVAWLLWHLTRVQDDHVAEAAGNDQTWTSGGWAARFALPFATQATGYGQTPDDVALVRVGAGDLLGYHVAVADATLTYVAGLRDGDLDRIVDRRFNPPVSLGVRLVSVLADDLQHVGQAAYLRGIAERQVRPT